MNDIERVQVLQAGDELLQDAHRIDRNLLGSWVRNHGRLAGLSLATSFASRLSRLELVLLLALLDFDELLERHLAVREDQVDKFAILFLW